MSYSEAENYDGVPVVLNDTRILLCDDCGALVLNTAIHTQWHESLKEIVANVYGVSIEDL